MHTYSSNEELFDHARNLIDRIQTTNDEASKILSDGFGSLNGLTDGWADLMFSIKDVLNNHRIKLPEADSNDLEELLSIISKIVHRS